MPVNNEVLQEMVQAYAECVASTRDMFTTEEAQAAAAATVFIQYQRGVSPGFNRSYSAANGQRSAAPAAPAGPMQSAVGLVVNVDSKQGISRKSGKPYTAYTVMLDDGQSYKTFDAKHAGACQQAQFKGAKVKVTYTSGQYGNDIKGVAVSQSAAPGPAPAASPAPATATDEFAEV